MTLTFDPERLLVELSEHDVEFVVIGGMAAFLQGSPLPTVDLDITPSPEPENLARLSAMLTEVDARVRAGGTEPLAFSHTGRSLAAVDMWNLSTKYGDLGIALIPSGTEGFVDLQRDAVPVTLANRRVLLASLDDIVRSKEGAGRDKDRRALPILRELAEEEARSVVRTLIPKVLSVVK